MRTRLLRNAQTPLTNPRGLDRWFNALADAERDPARLWWCGNSVMDGVSTDTTTTPSDTHKDTFGAAAILRNLFSREFDENPGFVVPAADTRWSNSGTIVNTSGTTVTGPSGVRASLMSSSATKTITTPYPCTSIRMHYYSGPSLGAFTVSIDGGDAVAVNGVNENPAAYASYLFTGLSDATHEVVITASASNAFFCGLECHSGRGVVIGKFGGPSRSLKDSYGTGSTSSGASAGGQERAKRGYAMGSPDCVVFGFVRNDWKSQGAVAYSVSDYVADLEQIYGYISDAGGCFLVVGEPDDKESETVTGLAYGPVTLDQYHLAAKSWAATKDHASFMWLKDIYGTWAEADANGFYRLSPGSSDEIHPGRIGQQKIGRLMHHVLGNKFRP